MTTQAFAIGDFVFDPVVSALIALALITGIALAARFGGNQRFALIALQPLAAGLLIAALSVHDAPEPATLVVLTPGAEAAQIEAVASLPRVALPGAPRGEGIEPVPDLATALRRHPAKHLVVIGEGLRRHDREAVGARSLEFRASPAASQPAILEIDAPATVRAGSWWTLRGRVQAPAGLSLVLLDPAGANVAEATPDAAGLFEFETLARAPGAAAFELQLRKSGATQVDDDAQAGRVQDSVLQTLPVPLLAQRATPMRALLLASAPSPELKYLRRWALDAGVQLEARIALAPGLAQRRGQVSLEAAQLAQLDLLIVDERSWTQLASAQPALREAADVGLGLLVRTTGPVPERVAREWKEWGLAVPAADKPIAIRLRAAPQTELHAWPVSPADARPMLVDSVDGVAVAQWHALGRGRVGSWRLTDTHRLYTRGDRERHATLWSHAFATLSRARAEAEPSLPQRALVGERATLCGIAADASIAVPAGDRVPLSVEQGCAAYWPRESGWHRLVSGNAEHRFHVHDPALLASVLTHERRAATQALVREEGFATQALEREQRIAAQALGREQRVATQTLERQQGTPTQALLREQAEATPTSDAKLDRDALRALLLAAWLVTMALAWGLERRARKARSGT